MLLKAGPRKGGGQETSLQKESTHRGGEGGGLGHTADSFCTDEGRYARGQKIRLSIQPEQFKGGSDSRRQGSRKLGGVGGVWRTQRGKPY